MTAHRLPLPSLPEIGHPETYYAKRIHLADKMGDTHAHEAYKVGQYVTLALDPKLSWPQKVRYFQHALKRHCYPPPLPDEDVWVFYRALAHLVREHCGAEALRLASLQDDEFDRRHKLGVADDVIADDAEVFFNNLMGLNDACPVHFHEEDWAQLKLIRDQWV